MRLAVQQYTREWEATQQLQLAKLTENVIKLLSLALFLIYLVLRFAWNIARIAFVPQPYSPLVRDEQWIYRHIK